MELPLPLHTFLLSAGALTEYDIASQNDKTVTLEAEATQLMEIGMKMSPLLNRLHLLKKQVEPETAMPLPGLSSLKNSVTPSARLANWNIIVKSLQTFDILVDEDLKNLIVAGDSQMIVEVLNMVQEKDEKLRKMVEFAKAKNEEAKSGAGSTGKMALSNKLLAFKSGSKVPTGTERSHAEANASPAKRGLVDIVALDISKDIPDTTSCLEFILITICRSFNLVPKQAAGLLTDSNKYLSHILIKGLKNDPEPVTAWLMEIYASSKHLADLVLNEDNPSAAIQMIYSVLKGGLYSKHREIATWTLKVITKTSNELTNPVFLKSAYEWFVALDSGLDGAIYLYKKHSHMIALIVDLFLAIAKGNYLEFFSYYLKNYLAESKETPALSYWKFVLILLQPIGIKYHQWTQADKNQFQLVLEYFLDCACRQADNDGRHLLEDRANALNILSELWLHFPDLLDRREEVANHALTMMKRACRDSNLAMQLFALAHMFSFLEQFAHARKPCAPQIYKTLAFFLIEAHSNVMTREFIMGNLQNIYLKLPNIPVGIVVEPLTRQIQLSENVTYFLNIQDFNFLRFLGKHPKLHINDAVKLLDILAREIVNTDFESIIASEAFLEILKECDSTEQGRDFMGKFVKVAINAIIGLVKKSISLKKASSTAENPKKVKSLAETEALEDSLQLLTLQTKIIVLTIYYLQALNDESLNLQMKELVLGAQVKIKQLLKPHDYQHLKILLTIYGEPNSLIAEYEGALAREAQQYRQSLVPVPQVSNSVIRPGAKSTVKQRGDDEENSREIHGHSINSIRAESQDNDMEDDLQRDPQGNRSALVEREPEESSNTGQTSKGTGAVTSSNHKRRRYQLVPYYYEFQKPDIGLKAIMELEKLKKMKVEREEMRRRSAEVLKGKMEREKRSLKQQLERRKIELGVATRNQQNASEQILLQEGLVEKDKRKMKKICTTAFYFC